MHHELDWLADLSTPVPTDAQLRAQLASCHGKEGSERCQLIKDSLTLRWSARILLERMRMVSGTAAAEPAANSALGIALSLIERRRPD